MLSAKIRGWESYYQHCAIYDSFIELTIRYFFPCGNGLNDAIPIKGSDGLKTAIGSIAEETTGLLRLNLRNQMERKTNSHCRH